MISRFVVITSERMRTLFGTLTKLRTQVSIAHLTEDDFVAFATMAGYAAGAMRIEAHLTDCEECRATMARLMVLERAWQGDEGARRLQDLTDKLVANMISAVCTEPVRSRTMALGRGPVVASLRETWATAPVSAILRPSLLLLALCIVALLVSRSERYAFQQGIHGPSLVTVTSNSSTAYSFNKSGAPDSIGRTDAHRDMRAGPVSDGPSNQAYRIPAGDDTPSHSSPRLNASIPRPGGVELPPSGLDGIPIHGKLSKLLEATDAASGRRVTVTVLATAKPIGDVAIGASVSLSAQANDVAGVGTMNSPVTNLLFPFITNQQGFDTSIQISNSSADELAFSTGSATSQSGTCTLTLYPTDMANPTATAVGNNPINLTTPNIALGQTYQLPQSASSFSAQSGYVLAVCRFLDAHGFAFVASGNISAATISQGHLAMIIPDPRSQTKTGTVYEILVH